MGFDIDKNLRSKQITVTVTVYEQAKKSGRGETVWKAEAVTPEPGVRWFVSEYSEGTAKGESEAPKPKAVTPKVVTVKPTKAVNASAAAKPLPQEIPIVPMSSNVLNDFLAALRGPQGEKMRAELLQAAAQKSA